MPTSTPTTQPSAVSSEEPSFMPTARPSLKPSAVPSEEPSLMPTARPSLKPSARPSIQPSSLPSGHPSVKPSRLSQCPAIQLNQCGDYHKHLFILVKTDNNSKVENTIAIK